jgi:hypothetical protein
VAPSALKSGERENSMQNAAIWSAISHEVRSGSLSQEALESLQRACEDERDILSADEAFELGLIMADSSLN